MSLDQSGNALGILINNAVNALNPPVPQNPLASNASAPNFAYSLSPGVTAQTTTYQDGYTYISIDYSNPILVTSYMPYVYLYDLPIIDADGYSPTDGYILDGYYQLIPDGYYSGQAAAAQLQIWTAVAQQILTYLVAKTQVDIPSLAVPATGIDDSTSHACTGTAHSTANTGGTIQ